MPQCDVKILPIFSLSLKHSIFFISVVFFFFMQLTVIILCFHRHVVKGMPMGFFIEEFFNVAEQFNPLQLTDEEIGIFSAVLLMNPGELQFFPQGHMTGSFT